MCAECGLVIGCHERCPNYDPRKDPHFQGWCESCGEPVWDEGDVLCAMCKEELEAMQHIEFDAERHEYHVNGEKVPCVSDIIAVFGNDVEEGDDLELLMDAAAERGTTCHYILASYLQGDLDVEYPDSYEPYVEAIRLFLAEHHIEPLSIETPVFCEKYGYAGTPDLLCMFDGELTVIDYKFVSQIAKTKVKAQLNAYAYAYEEAGIYPDHLKAVQFLNDGTYRIYPVAYGLDELEAAVTVWNLKRKKHKRGEIS